MQPSSNHVLEAQNLLDFSNHELPMIIASKPIMAVFVDHIRRLVFEFSDQIMLQKNFSSQDRKHL